MIDVRKKSEQPLEVPKRVAGWVVKPPDLKRNQETLKDHRARMIREGRRPLTRDEEEKLFPGETDA